MISMSDSFICVHVFREHAQAYIEVAKQSSLSNI